MTLTADEQRDILGEPVELYTFTLAGYGSYYYTDYFEDVSHGGNTFLAIPIDRGVLQGAGQEDESSLVITVPYTLDVATLLLFQQPPRTATVKIERYHVGNIADIETVWDSVITKASRRKREVTIESQQTIGVRLENPIPWVKFQNQCNHVLYDANCTVVKSDPSNEFAATVSSVIDSKNFVVSTVGGEPDGSFNGGEIIRDSDGERRLILSQTGTTITLLFPFATLNATDAVTLYRGCAHTADDCRTKFNNLDNYGGHPNMVYQDLFRFGLKNR